MAPKIFRQSRATRPDLRSDATSCGHLGCRCERSVANLRPLHEEVIMRRLFLIAGLLVCLVGPGAAEPFRNPFGVADVADPVSSEIRKLAEKVSLQGDGRDQNAEQWVPETTGHGGSGLDGAWY